jgi:hypothetical protein
MPSGGTNRLPDAIKRLRGTWRRDREIPRLLALQKVLPASPTPVPEPPEDLDELHRAAWTEHAEAVDSTGIFRLAYLGAFRKLVQAYVLSEKLLARIDVEGKGVASWRLADGSYRNLVVRFGLTPGSALAKPSVASPVKPLQVF